MKWFVYTVLGAALALCAVATVASADFAMHLQGTQPTVEAMHAEGGVVYVARLDGSVQALDRASERVLWTRELSSGPGTRALDMVSEPGANSPLYVATSIDANGKSEPIVALRKSDGAVLWSSTTAFQDAGHPHLAGFDDVAKASDAYRLALDTGRDSPYLWAGLEHGYVVVLHKATGMPVLDDGGAPRALDPTARDRLTPLAGVPCLRPSGIYALAVHDNQLWAARNFGGVDKQGSCANPLLTSLFNVVYWLNADLIVDAAGRPIGNDTMQWDGSLRADPIDPANCVCPDGRRFALPSILDIYVDPTTSDEEGQVVYFGGAFTGKAGALFGIGTAGTPTQPGQSPTIFCCSGPIVTNNDDDLEFQGPTVVGTSLLEMGERSVVSAIEGDGTHLYVSTWMNDTLSLPNPVAPGGVVVKFTRQLFAVDWPYRHGPNNAAMLGRSWEAGDANALFVEPGPDGKVLVGHGNAVPPYPGVGDPHRMGALVVETPKGRDPVPVLMLPYALDVLGGQSPVAFRTDHPLNDAASPVRAEIEWTLGMASDSWTRLTTLNLPSAPGNDYSITNNVPLSELPERDDIRLRVKVTGRDGLVGTDRTDGLVTIDRTAPVISAFGVQGPAGEVRHAATHNPVVRTATPSFFVRGNDTCPLATAQCGASDIDPSRSFLWIDDPSHAYPFLSFQEPAGYVRGFTFDMAQAHPYGGLPSRLSDGPHVVHAQLVDHAGNFDFERWSIDVDTGVLAPTVTPLDGTWVAEARPTWTVQFQEDVEIVSVRVDGAALTGGYQVYPKHATQNPDGTRIVVRAPADLADGHVATLVLEVRDRAGNAPTAYSSTLRVDRAGPAFTLATPVQDALLPDARPTVSVKVRDDRSGLSVGATRFLLDGQAQPGARFEADRVLFVPGTDLASGPHTVRVEARDLAGNTAAHAWSFSIDAQAPSVTLSATVPDGQSAAKRGDEVRIEALVPGSPANVTIDARALDPTAKAVPAKAQGAGRYVATVKVTEARTGELQLLATATDAVGHKGTGQATVTVDNRPPVAFMLELPSKVAHSFLLSWAQDGEKDAAHYVLEVQVDGGAWRVADALVQGTTYHWEPVGGPATLRFRVSAVDGAGNRQSAPSNVVETELVASPIDTILVPDPWPLQGDVVIAVTPVGTARLRQVVAELTLPNGTMVVQTLDAAGTLFRGTWNVTTEAGTGRLDLLLEDDAGAVIRISHPITFQEGRSVSGFDVQGALQEKSASRGAPLPGALLALAALAVAISRRRQH